MKGVSVWQEKQWGLTVSYMLWAEGWRSGLGSVLEVQIKGAAARVPVEGKRQATDQGY